MTSFIRDPFQIKKLERLVKRPLTEAELEGMAPVRYRDANGQTKAEWVRKLNFRDFYTK